MEEHPTVTEEALRRDFADTLDKGDSRCGILVSYRDSEWVRTEFSVPYSINQGILEVGPYLKDKLSGRPRDYDNRKKPIPISNIIGYRRIELSSLL